jgi:hypothetical protein
MEEKVTDAETVKGRYTAPSRTPPKRASYVIDIESTGPHPVLYSMVNIDIVNIDTMESRSFRMKPRPGTTFDALSMRANGLTWNGAMTRPDPQRAMRRFEEWVNVNSGGVRPIIWSDNPAFDWSFLNAYMHMYLGKNGLGWTARRIGDYYAGQHNDPWATTAWKQYREAPDTKYQSLGGARGNAEALRRILADPNL